MSRNACMQCRLRKVKCNQSETIGDRCQRCVSRNLPCSKTRGPRPSRPIDHPSDHNDIEERSQDRARSAYRPPNWIAVSGGRPRPRDILREEELTVELLRLYFVNYSDVHFMFDKESFLRKYLKGETSKLILYSILSLSARFSNDPVFESVPAAHRGDAFYEEARQLLKSEFDLVSITLIQAYVLLSTYHLTFGGSKRSWTYLGAASNLAKIMELAHDDEPDPLEKEMCRRLLCTIALMDRTLSLSLNVSCHLTPDDFVPQPCSDAELRRIRSRCPPPLNGESPENLTLGILDLAKSFREICFYHRHGGLHEEWQRLEAQMIVWHSVLHEKLVYTRANFDAHHAVQASREFIYLHLLYHHVCQLIYFPFLQANGHISYGSELGRSYVARCHHHARRIAEITEETWTHGGFDLHNASIGQILSVAAAVHTHVSLTSNSTQQEVSSKANLLIITNCLARLREHTRIFDRILTRVDAFLQICRRSPASQRVFDKNERLLRQILHYGTASERSKYGDTGRQNKPREQSSLASSSAILPRLTFVASNVAMDLNSPSPAHSASQVDDPFQNYAWIFSDSSLNDLYSMSFVNPNSSMDGLDLMSGQSLDADLPV